MTDSPLAIAVVGLGALFPGRLGMDGFWRDILDRRDAIREVPPTHWLIEDYYDPDPSAPDKTYCKRGGFLDPVPFNPIELGLPPVALPSTDTAQILALVVARQVLAEVERARVRAVDRSRTSVILGVASATELVAQYAGRLSRPAWIKGLREAGLHETQVQEIAGRIASNFVPWTEASFPGLLGNVVAGRIANRLDLGGTNYVTDAACASSLSALQGALRELQAGDSDLVITGGVDALNDILMFMCFSKTPAFSPTGDCRPFSDRADGTIIGEGVGMLALRRLADAERDGDRIYAVIRGLGASSDGRATSVYAPRPQGQALALRRAYEQAGYSPSTVELIEAHGTGTVAGDAAEFASLRSVFDNAGERQWCALGSVKSQIGHTKAAAGSAGLIKTVLALHHKILPPTIKIDRPNPELGLADSPFYLNTQPRPWIRRGDHPRRASVSSFGFGGSNFHVTLEEYTGAQAADRIRHMPAELVLLSASTKDALAERVSAIANDDRPLARIAMEACAAFSPADAYRLAIVASDAVELHGKLESALRLIATGASVGGPAAAPGVHLSIGPAFAGKVAFLFPGQGSQYVNMGADLAMTFGICRDAWDRAASIAPLHRIVFPPPAFSDEERKAQEARLTAQEHAQPAIAAVSLAQLALLDAVGLRADYALGHSFGEVMALHAAGVFDASHALAIAERRGRLMADSAAGRAGAMIAVSMSRDDIEQRLADWTSDLVVANDNAPEQVILSGPTQSIEAAIAALTADHIACVRLPVASAFHSPTVAASQEPFEAFLATMPFESAAIPVIANSTAAPYPADPARQRALLAGQIARTVRFRESVERLYGEGVRLFVEVGPGGVLTRLVDQTLGKQGADRRSRYEAVALDRRGKNGVTECLDAMARLAALGLPLDYTWLFNETPPREPHAPARTATTLDVLGSNYGKPYPPKAGASALPAPNLSSPLMSDTSAPPEPPAKPAAALPPPLSASSTASMMPTTANAAPAPQPASTAGTDLAMLIAQVAETHRSFQQNMAAAHQSFLGMVERVLTGAPLTADAATAPAIAAAAVPAVTPTAATNPAEIWMAPPPTAPAAFAAAPRIEPAGQPSPQPASASHQSALRQSSPQPAAPAAAASLVTSARDTLLAIVSEKTGYPLDMLALDMEIEAHLGIDSIKQVEILSAFREQRPDLPEIAPHQLATLRTLGAIVAFADSAMVTNTAPSASGAAVATAATAPAEQVRDVLLAIVSEKTGYPLDMLALDMEIEANLGIDSIKQVEILSAFRERRPDLPEIAPHQLATLRTLGAIVAFAEQAGQDEPGSLISPTAAPLAPEGSDPVVRQVLTLVPAQPAGMGLPRLIGDVSVAVTGGSEPLRATVARILCERGVDAEASADPDAASAARGVIELGGLDMSLVPRDATRVLAAALAQARTLGRRVGPDGEGLFVTVQDTGGTFGLDTDPADAAWCAGLPALAKTVALEYPRIAVKAIDIARDGRSLIDFAHAIVDELLLGGPELEIGLPDRQRRLTVLAREATPPPVEAAPRSRQPRALRDGQVVVVSGGARGITPHTLVALAREARLRFVLLGRTRPLTAADDPFLHITEESALRTAFAQRARSLGDDTLQPRDIAHRVATLLAWRETAASIAALRAAGAEVRYIPLDIRDAGAVAQALANVRADWGSIDAAIHAAGVIADKRLVDKIDAQVDRVIGTKLDGLAALLDATRDDALAWMCLFSSAAARAGNVGQSDYAMANEVLNKVAQREARRRPNCVVKSIAWGPWDGGMVTPALRDQFKQRGIPLIGLDAGAAFLVRELTSGDRTVEVIAGSGALHTGDRRWIAEVAVSSITHPYLKDHVVNGRPIVPAVLLIEWCLRMAAAIDPLGRAREVRDLNVVRPLALRDFARGDVARYIVIARPASEKRDALAITITDRQGTLHCAATVDLTPSPLATAPASWRAAGGDVTDWRWNAQEVYDEGRLFHGSDFHVIRSLDGVSNAGAAATIVGVDEQGWPGAPWITDPAALDGGLQLAAAWGVHRTGQHFLPTRVGRIRWIGSAAASGPLRCELSSRLIGRDKMVSELVFTAADGRLIASLDGLEMFATDAAPVTP